MARRGRHRRRDAAARRDSAARRDARSPGPAEPETGTGATEPAAFEAEAAGRGDPVCPICLRPIPPHARQSVHHLIPKLKGGANGPTVLVHQICHNEIHSVLSEAELARDYATPERLRAHPALRRFADWVRGRDPAFHAPTVGNRRKRRRP